MVFGSTSKFQVFERIELKCFYLRKKSHASVKSYLLTIFATNICYIVSITGLGAILFGQFNKFIYDCHSS